MTKAKTRVARSAGVTLIELLIATLLLSFISLGIVLTLRVALSGMTKSDTKLMANRRVSSVERILGQEIEGIMPVTANCQTASGESGGLHMFFQGEEQTVRFASSYSLQQGERGIPMILEYQVIPGLDDQGVRLIVNEHWYTGPRGAGAYCISGGGGAYGARFLPVAIGPDSFVLADKLAYCRFSFRDARQPGQTPVWLPRWEKSTMLPSAVRIEIAPLAPDLGRLQPVTLTIPVRVTRLPMEKYDNQWPDDELLLRRRAASQ
ncbi:MAG TPA: hypothetical protein VFW44_10530 [Bryobacteraceae bacterium]|nr:hypothetical protein [Bryobacteraceae bacterium]